VSTQSPFSTNTNQYPASRALIIGAGISGPVTAMALARADISSVIYEAGGPAVTDSGPYLTIANSGLAALDAIGARALVEAGGFVTRGTAIFNSAGKQLCTVGGDAASVTIRRGRLKRLLQEEAIRRGIRFEFGKRLVKAVVVERGAEAWFADGTITSGEMLIGCDGVRSMVRRIIDPLSPPPRDRALLNFYGYTPSISAGTPGQWQMIFGRRACFGYALDPAGGTVWFANVPRSTSVADDGEILSHDDWTRLLIGHFAQDAGPAAELIAAGTMALDIYAAHDLPHVPRWHSGPLIVIGDAAHTALPASGQGASLAMEDGVVLAKCVSQLPTQPAFQAFERTRRRRVERAVAQAARSGRRRVPGPIGRIVRDLALMVACRYWIAEASLAWMSDSHVDCDQPVVNA
jgi:FAD-dependent urate hydroxylase